MNARFKISLVTILVVVACVDESQSTPIRVGSSGNTSSSSGGSSSGGSSGITMVDAGDPDAGGCVPDPAAPCDTCRPFGEPSVLNASGLSTNGNDFGGRVDNPANPTAIVFSTNRLGSMYSMVTASLTLGGAPSLGQAFPVGTIQSADAMVPTWPVPTGNMYFATGTYTNRRLQVVNTSATAGTLTVAGAAQNLFATGAQPGAGEEDADPHVVGSSSPRAMYYTSTRNGGVRKIHYTTNLAQPGGPLLGPVNTVGDNAGAWTTQDELVLMFSRSTANGMPYFVQRATRSNVNQDFGVPEPVTYQDSAMRRLPLEGFVASVAPNQCWMLAVVPNPTTREYRINVLRRPAK